MNTTFNTIVLGLGAMGSASLYQLAKRGQKVLGIDQFSPPHTLGSSHGDTRITRQAIGESKQYTPLSLRSYQLFREIEQATNKQLLQLTGGLIISSNTATARNYVPEFFENTLAAAEKFNIQHKILTAEEIRREFPQFNVQDNEIGYYEYEAGFLRPEECITAQLLLAEKYGATIHRNEKVKDIAEVAGEIIISTDVDTYKTQKLVVTAGAWLPELLGQELGSLFKIHRQVLYWFDISSSFSNFEIGKFPVFLWNTQGAGGGIYGFPAIDGPTGGFKIATAQYKTTVTPHNIKREVSSEETNLMYKNHVAPYFHGINSKCVKSAVCMYTVTPDAEFVIDTLPQTPAIIVCSPCSGHGFKHSAAIGECISQLVMDGTTQIDISGCSLSRLIDKSPQISN